jgi:NitT/TauT family transport system substrate-binding protein
VMDPAAFDNTAQIALDYGVIQNEASSEAYITDYAEAAVVALEEEGVDVKGEDYEPEEVEVTPGGE